MSKTVKRAIRVMMIGLVAMLGAKAEAHYYVVAGKAKYCSVCVDAELAEHEEHPVNPATSTEVPDHGEGVEFCVKTKKITVLCPNEVKKVWAPAKLIVRQPIRSGVSTRFDLKSLVDPHFCQGMTPPIAVLARRIRVAIKTYACADPTNSDPANSDPTKCETVSEWKAKCKLPKEYGFHNPPVPGVTPPVPAGVTAYDCSWQIQNDGPDEADGPDDDGSFPDE